MSYIKQILEATSHETIKAGKHIIMGSMDSLSSIVQIIHGSS